MKVLPFILKAAGDMISRLPIERVLVKPRDTIKDREELLNILATKPEPPPAKSSTAVLEPRRKLLPSPSAVSESETIAYQKREIGKLLLVMERHFRQKMRINNIPCDCGASKHLLDMEMLAEETIPMVEDCAIYSRLLEWVRKVGPLSTEEAAKSGKYDDIYPQFSHEARDFRKDIIGSLDPKALWPGSSATLEDLFKKHEEMEAPVGLLPEPVEEKQNDNSDQAQTNKEMP